MPLILSRPRARVLKVSDPHVRYGSLVAMTVATKRDPKPRRTDLMIAAIASSRDLPLHTRDPKDFAGLDDLVTIVAV